MVEHVLSISSNLLGEKLAAFEVWNENSASKKAVYLKMKTDKYGSVIVALMKMSPGEKFCIKFNTEGRHVKSNESLK